MAPAVQGTNNCIFSNAWLMSTSFFAYARLCALCAGCVFLSGCVHFVARLCTTPARIGAHCFGEMWGAICGWGWGVCVWVWVCVWVVGWGLMGEGLFLWVIGSHGVGGVLCSAMPSYHFTIGIPFINMIKIRRLFERRIFINLIPHGKTTFRPTLEQSPTATFIQSDAFPHIWID